MTLIQVGAPGIGTTCRPVRRSIADRGGRCRRMSGPLRPGGAPMRYRRIGVAMSVTPHAQRPVSITATVILAVLTGLVTAWLVLIAHLSAMAGGDSVKLPTPTPDRVAVVRVQPGETLQGSAVRVAPDAAVWQVAGRIRELNNLAGSIAVGGQTLIAPVG